MADDERKRTADPKAILMGLVLGGVIFFGIRRLDELDSNLRAIRGELNGIRMAVQQQTEEIKRLPQTTRQP
jgi:hypothetical protein